MFKKQRAQKKYGKARRQGGHKPRPTRSLYDADAYVKIEKSVALLAIGSGISVA